MKFRFLIVALILLSLILSTITITASSKNTDYRYNAPVDNSPVEDTHVNNELPTSQMAVVKLPEVDTDDLNYNKLEDIFEPILDSKDTDEIVEAIIRTEFRITETFTNFLEKSGAEIVYVTHGVESVGIKIEKSKLLFLTEDSRISMIYGNSQGKWMLDTSVPVVEADAGALSDAGYSDIDGSGVTVAIIDTGADGSHRTFPAGKIIAFKDMVNGRDDLNPTDGMNAYDHPTQPHGTMTASCAAGSGGGTSRKGSAPGAYLIIVRVGGSSFDIAQAVQWCINNKNTDFNKDGVADGPDVISMSLGTSPSNYIDQTCTQAVSAGIVFVTSAGNSGPSSSSVTSPARAKNIIAVGGVHDNKNIWYYSSRGPGAGGITKPDICAPGVQVTVAYPGNRWIITSGTSFSGPIAAGVVALILQLKPDLSPSEVMEILHETSEDRGSSGPDNAYGWGVVDAVAALDSIPTIRELMISQTTVEEDEEINFDARTTGLVIKYEWDFDGDGIYDYLSTSSSGTSHSYPESGFYEVSFRITDSDGDTQVLTELVAVENVEPELNVLCGCVNIHEDDKVEFNVSETYDTPTDQAKLKYTWDFDDGASIDTYDTYISHSYKNQGIYEVEVTVTDDNNAKDTETFSIMVSNIVPIADAGPNRVVEEDEQVFFSGGASYDTPSDMGKLNYSWDMGDGIMIYKKEFYYTYENSGKYTLALVVTDDNGGQDKTYIRTTVKNVVPSIDIEEIDDNIRLKEDEKVTLHGLVNDTPSDLETLEFSWDFDDGTELDWDTDNLEVTHAFKSDGEYDVVLKVKDDDGSVNKTRIKIRVDNLPPEADFSVSEASIWEDSSIYFDASTSTDTPSDLAKLEYIWDFNDGEEGTGETIEHVFIDSGTFQVKLRVRDDDTEESTHIISITVKNIAPKAIISAEREIVCVGEAINFSGKSSWDSASDYNKLAYNWDFGDDYPESGMLLTEVSHTFFEPGEYKVILTVTDDDGISNSASVTVTIEAYPEEHSLSDVFNLNDTEGQLTVFAIVLIIVLALLIVFVFAVQSRKKKKWYGAAGIPRRKRRSRTLMRKRSGTTPIADYNQMVQQQQMIDYQMYQTQFGVMYAPGQAQQMPVPMQGGTGVDYYSQGQGAQIQPPSSMPPPSSVPPPVFGGYTRPVLPPATGEITLESFEQTEQLPPQEFHEAEPEEEPVFDSLTQPSVPATAAAENGKKNFCGSCGASIKPNWLICPECKNLV